MITASVMKGLNPILFLHSFVNFMEKKLQQSYMAFLISFFGSYEVTRFLMIRRCLHVNEVVPSNEHM